MRILIVEDDPIIRESLEEYLTDQYYLVDVADNGQDGWILIESYPYDLILLDWILPKLSGIQLCQRLRQQGNNVPILLLTARDTNTDKITGLDAGADDYVVKPFDLLVLSAQIRALLRRGGKTRSPLLQWGKLLLNSNTYEVSYQNRFLTLTPKEYRLLELFLRHERRVFSKSQILELLWSWEELPTEATVKTHIKSLRAKLKAAGASPDLIETVHGIGYRLKERDLVSIK